MAIQIYKKKLWNLKSVVLLWNLNPIVIFFAHKLLSILVKSIQNDNFLDAHKIRILITNTSSFMNTFESLTSLLYVNNAHHTYFTYLFIFLFHFLILIYRTCLTLRRIKMAVKKGVYHIRIFRYVYMNTNTARRIVYFRIAHFFSQIGHHLSLIGRNLILKIRNWQVYINLK